MDTFVCSSWYYLRYPDNKDDKMAWDPAIINKMLPVDKYIGGAEHACMHLLYARFFTKAFRDMGYLNFDEPFASLVHQGVILGPDGERMSKSRGQRHLPGRIRQQIRRGRLPDVSGLWLLLCGGRPLERRRHQGHL